MHLAERILRNRARAGVELRDAHRFLDDRLLPVDDGEALPEAAGDVRQVLDDDAPVPARLAIQIHRLRAGFLDAAGRLHRRAEHVIVQEVAEHERDAAGRIGAESIGADADGRLADRLELQLRLDSR